MINISLTEKAWFKKVSPFIFYGILALSPWFDTIGLLTSKVKINLPLLRHAKSTGLLNLLFVSSTLFVLVPSLLTSLQNKKNDWRVWLVLAWPVFNILNSKFIGPTWGTAVENSLLLATITLVFLKKDDLDLPKLESGLPVFLFSYMVSILIPFLFGDAETIHVNLGTTQAFRGWTTVMNIGYCGVALSIWGLRLIDRSQKSRDLLGPIFWFLFGVIGDYLSIFRIGLIAITVSVVFMVIRNIFSRSHRHLGIYTMILCIPLMAILSYRVSAKSFSTQENKYRMSAVFFQYKKIFLSISHLDYNELSDAVNTNGRVAVTNLLVHQIKQNNFFIGAGTGRADQFMRENMPEANTPHNDYLRIIFDHGILGLFLFFLIAVVTLIRLRKSEYLLFFISFAIIMLTDNIMVFPGFGYLPLFLSFIANGQRKTERLSVASS